MARSPRVANKRAIGYQVKALENASQKIAEVAQDYPDAKYPKHGPVFRLIYTNIEIARDLLMKLEATI